MVEGAVGGGGGGGGEVVLNPTSCISHMTGEKVPCPTMGDLQSLGIGETLLDQSVDSNQQSHCMPARINHPCTVMGMIADGDN